MKKRIFALFLICCLILVVTGCAGSAGNSELSVTFIDVGQGDAALIKCAGEYMLIDTGPKDETSSERIRKLLLDENIKALKYLVISHLHDDHYGGLVKDALKNVKIKTTLCNESPHKKSDVLSHLKGSRVVIPKLNETYKLGNATIKVIDVRAEQPNDSLVLLINHGDTNFLFTGDIEKEAHSRVAGVLRKMSDNLEHGENLIKMPHHGAYNSDRFLPENASDNSLATLISAAYAKYFVISVGANNTYKHPHQNTLDLIEQVLDVNELNKATHLFRTDYNGDIVATSDGSKITVTPSKCA
jgi:competence protein ComEC